jgi:F-type H+-transporting ATPase subunit delta
MITSISNKYANALVASSKDDLTIVASILNDISSSFKIDKMNHIIYSVTDKNKIVDFILSLSSNKNEKVNNLVKILCSRNKLTIIPQISQIIDLALAKKNNDFIGYVYSKENVTAEELTILSNSISKKLDKNITLKVKKSNFDGINIDIPILSLEIVYSKSQIKKQLINLIVNSI